MRIFTLFSVAFVLTACALIPNPFAKYSKAMVNELTAMVRDRAAGDLTCPRKDLMVIQDEDDLFIAAGCKAVRQYRTVCPDGATNAKDCEIKLK